MPGFRWPSDQELEVAWAVRLLDDEFPWPKVQKSLDLPQHRIHQNLSQLRAKMRVNNWDTAILMATEVDERHKYPDLASFLVGEVQ